MSSSPVPASVQYHPSLHRKCRFLLYIYKSSSHKRHVFAEWVLLEEALERIGIQTISQGTPEVFALRALSPQLSLLFPNMCSSSKGSSPQEAQATLVFSHSASVHLSLGKQTEAVRRGRGRKEKKKTHHEFSGSNLGGQEIHNFSSYCDTFLLQFPPLKIFEDRDRTSFVCISRLRALIVWYL